MCFGFLEESLDTASFVCCVVVAGKVKDLIRVSGFLVYNFNQFYVRQTGGQLKTRIYEYQLAVKWHDPKSLIIRNTDNKWNGTKAKSLATPKTHQALYQSNGSINKHIDLLPAYKPIREQTILTTD